jgi:hypothetical protein
MQATRNRVARLEAAAQSDTRGRRLVALQGPDGSLWAPVTADPVAGAIDLLSGDGLRQLRPAELAGRDVIRVRFEDADHG